MRNLLAQLTIVVTLLAFSSAQAQVLYPLGDTGKFCLISSDNSRFLADIGSSGYHLVTEDSVVKAVNKKIKKIKAKINSLAAAVSSATTLKARQKLKKKIKAGQTQIKNLKLEKTRIADCLNGAEIPVAFSPLKVASQEKAGGDFIAFAYIDPDPIRIPFSGGYVQYGGAGSSWCLTFTGTFADLSTPWQPGTVFQASKTLDLCADGLNVPAGACKDKFGAPNQGIVLNAQSGPSDEEARAAVLAVVGTIQYSARPRVTSSCEADTLL